MSETFTMALAILNCHGSRVDGLEEIKRQSKDVLTLDYMGLNFKVASENADKVASLIKPPGMFDKAYRFDGGMEYDSLPIYKIVETISREFKNKVNALIKPVPARQEFVKDYVLGPDSGTGRCQPNPSYITGTMRTCHEEFRAMMDQLVSCKLLPYKKSEKTGKGIFGMRSVQDTRPPVFHGKSFKIIQNLRNKEYSFSEEEEYMHNYIKFMKVSVTITSTGFVQFRVLDTIEQPYAFNEAREVVVYRNQVITDLMAEFPECNLVTLIDLTCNTRDDYDAETERAKFRIPRANLSDSEPGEGGGKKLRLRSKKRGRKSIHRRNKSIRRRNNFRRV